MLEGFGNVSDLVLVEGFMGFLLLDGFGLSALLDDFGNWALLENFGWDSSRKVTSVSFRDHHTRANINYRVVSYFSNSFQNPSCILFHSTRLYHHTIRIENNNLHRHFLYMSSPCALHNGHPG
jgi:hypothetical protein